MKSVLRSDRVQVARPEPILLETDAGINGSEFGVRKLDCAFLRPGLTGRELVIQSGVEPPHSKEGPLLFNMPNSHSSPITFILYDLDGTLLDAFEDIQIALNYGLSSCGLPTHPIERVKTFVGDGIEHLVRRALPKGSEGRFAEVLPLVASYYRENPSATAKLYPGVAETLTSIHAKGIKQAILTNKPHAIAVSVCERLGLSRLVEKIQGESPDCPLKPNPEAALRIAREFGYPAESGIVVGDGRPDAALAKAAGMRFVGCAWGMLTREELQAMRPWMILDVIGELIALIDS